MCGLFWGAHKSLAPRARTLLGCLGQATLSSFAVATLLFVLVGECPKFCDLAKQRRKIVGGVSEVGKDDFSLYFFSRCVIFLVFYFSSAAIARHRGQHQCTTTLEQWMVALVKLVRSVLTEELSDDYAASDHWSKYWNAVSAPSDDEWPEGLTEDGDKLFLKEKLLVPENRMEELIDHWHNPQLMHPGRDKMQQDLEWRFKFPPGYYALLDKYCSDCAVCRATNRPQPLHGWQPGVYGYTGGPYAVRGHGRIRHAGGHRGRRDLRLCHPGGG